MPDRSIWVPWMYMAIPVIALLIALARSRRADDLHAVRAMLITAVAGAAAGMLMIVIYLRELRGHVPLGQVLIACYWGIAVAFVISAVNVILAFVLGRLMPFGRQGQACCPAAEVAAKVLRSILLMAFAIPYVGGMALLYRPHVVNTGTPMSLLGADYQDVTFHATDGVSLHGWWIPASESERSDSEARAGNDGERTVILCHGFGADKASQLRLVRDLVPNGFNVLAFDFRGHGESSGQLSTFGDLERRDVLGAVRWVRLNHTAQAKKIFGLGESLGAAALIAAAGDRSDEGQAIDAIAVFSPYDRMTSLMKDVSENLSMPVGGWIAAHLALPAANLQMGTALNRFDPESLVDKLAPRPLLVIATEQDREIDMQLSRAFYNAASQPKYAYWMTNTNRDAMLYRSYSASLAVRVFFETSRPIL